MAAGENGIVASCRARAAAADRDDLLLDDVPTDPAPREHCRADRVRACLEDAEQEVLGVDVVVAQRAGSGLGLDDRQARVGAESRHTRAAVPHTPHVSQKAAVALLNRLTRDAEHRPDLCP